MRRQLLLGSLALLFPLCALAQDTDVAGTITGTVTDAVTGAPIPGVNMILEEASLGAASDVDGQYEITDVPPGQYTLVASFIGFRRYNAELDVQAGEEVVQDIPLREDLIGLDEVVVTGQGSAIENRRLSTTVDVISAKQIEQLPGQQLDQLLQTAL
ncbi:MAG: carboxypeptidase-like regulatory domain-containing protein, partial [Rhodothermales bacterium]